jgi:hypothetical protein
VAANSVLVGRCDSVRHITSDNAVIRRATSNCSNVTHNGQPGFCISMQRASMSSSSARCASAPSGRSPPASACAGNLSVVKCLRSFHSSPPNALIKFRAAICHRESTQPLSIQLSQRGTQRAANNRCKPAVRNVNRRRARKQKRRKNNASEKSRISGPMPQLVRLLPWLPRHFLSLQHSSLRWPLHRRTCRRSVIHAQTSRQLEIQLRQTSAYRVRKAKNSKECCDRREM